MNPVPLLALSLLLGAGIRAPAAWAASACADGIDNDGDELVDFPDDPGCVARNDTDETATVAEPSQKPRVLIAIAAGGTLNGDTCAGAFTGGDGSSECPGSDVSAATCASPTAGNFAGEFSHKFVDALLRIGHASHEASKPEDARPRAAAPPPIVALRPARMGRIACLAIGASTGGLHALSAFLRRLTPQFEAPILITQHLPPPFMPYFAAQLRDIARRPTSVAADTHSGTPSQRECTPNSPTDVVATTNAPNVASPNAIDPSSGQMLSHTNSSTASTMPATALTRNAGPTMST